MDTKSKIDEVWTEIQRVHLRFYLQNMGDKYINDTILALTWRSRRTRTKGNSCLIEYNTTLASYYVSFFACTDASTKHLCTKIVTDSDRVVPVIAAHLGIDIPGVS